MNIYEKHERAFPTTSAYAIVSSDGETIAKVSLKHGARLTAFVHFPGFPMTRGWAGGGGYDRASAAVAEAARKTVLDDEHLSYSKHPRLVKWALKEMCKDEGEGWDNSLRRLNLHIIQVI